MEDSRYDRRNGRDYGSGIGEGMYSSVTGNKGWQPVNENYASLFLTHLQDHRQCIKY